jgi:hypothetical protein
MDIGLGGFGKEEQAARLQNAVKLSKGFLLPHQVVKGLVAKNNVSDSIRQADGSAIAFQKLDLHLVVAGTLTRDPQIIIVQVNANEALGVKGAFQEAEGPALTATDIHDYRVRFLPVVNQPVQVADGDFEDAIHPDFGAEKPNTEASFWNKQRLIGGNV